jgi:cell division septal protein FtsQ
MSEQRKNILGFLFLLLITSALFFLAFSPASRMNEEKVEQIKIEGNYLLEQYDYLAFVKLKNKQDYIGIGLAVIKDRFQKHPYVERADVRFEDKNSVKVFLTEKKIIGLIVEDLETYFLSESHKIFPVLPHTKFIELPIITNHALFVKRSKDNYGDVTQAIKIINAAELTNSELYKELSEINLRNGRDVVLTFNGLRLPVIFGRGDEARKMIYLEAILDNKFLKEQLNSSGSYLDLRFASRIFIGNSEDFENCATFVKTGSYQ